MEATGDSATPDSAAELKHARVSPAALVLAGALLLLTTAGALVTYKAAGAVQVFAKARAEGSLPAKARWIETAALPAAVRPLVDSLNYLSWVVIALAFGVVIGAMVRAFVPSRWLQRTLAVEGPRGQVIAALVGAPLMLCSCCAAPVFEGVYQRTRRLGPALGLMLAAPALNPAALAVTFLAFPASVGNTRLGVSLVLVLLGAAVLGRAFRDSRPPEPCPLETGVPGWGRLAWNFGASLRAVAWRSLPAILLGVVASVAFVGLWPIDAVARAGGGAGAVMVIALVTLAALPLALPTFGEVPLALALLAAGAPLGAAAALLVAGPAINLPSLLTLARLTSGRIAIATAATVFAGALASGLLVQSLIG